MNTQKVAITVPKPLIDSIDRISKEKGLSRSRYITLALNEKLADEKRKLLKESYDRIFSDPEILKEQLETAKWLEGAGSEGGQEW
jgi:hypothetical protein